MKATRYPIYGVIFLIYCSGANSQPTGRDLIEHRKLVDAYVSAFPIALIAGKTCPNVIANMTKLVALRAAAKISDAEEKMVERGVQLVATEVGKVIEKNGAPKWCASVLSLYGEQGSAIPGLIGR